ncbi:hypothetical protein [Sphingopyxis panaciterrulae]|uniref:Uncharacterized protein n=1 Tax=Sphingopyxis panaciterrulae TaxID=462372 RepID=A0A7W9B6S4_9SPHN|nr:hypothetical protein [Sphingopyxis panaciterrulae]MBB5707319.1 hypothetical protein [Sphingopyxis panaciterrulae]
MQTQPLEPGRLYLSLFHGRKSIDEQLDDWGFDGPTIGPLEYVQVTYMGSFRFSCGPAVMDYFFPEAMADWRRHGFSNANGPLCDWQFDIAEDLIHYRDAYYGDWSVFLAGPEPDHGANADVRLASASSITAPSANGDHGPVERGDPMSLRHLRALAANALPFRLPPIVPISCGAMRVD